MKKKPYTTDGVCGEKTELIEYIWKRKEEWKSPIIVVVLRY